MFYTTARERQWKRIRFLYKRPATVYENRKHCRVHIIYIYIYRHRCIRRNAIGEGNAVYPIETVLPLPEYNMTYRRILFYCCTSRDDTAFPQNLYYLFIMLCLRICFGRYNIYIMMFCWLALATLVFFKCFQSTDDRIVYNIK